MAVITISRELGSGGDEVADRLCDALGYSRVDKDMLSHIAEEAGVDVKAVLAKEKAVVRRPHLVSSDMTSLYAKDPTAFTKRTALDDQTYARIVRETMEKYAIEGRVVVVGRGGQMVLRDEPTALHVCLFAAEEVRVQRVMGRLDVSVAEARRRIKVSDERKRQYIRRMHNNANWKKFSYYDLAINTEHVSLETVAQMILLAVQDKDRGVAAE